MIDFLESREPYQIREDRAEVLVRNISKYIRAYNVGSLLDIGAGYISTAVRLSRSVNRYLAIEKDGVRAAELRSSGLEVINNQFPLSIGDTFDMVLSCHSVPEDSVESYDSFLDCAWEMTNPGGVLLIVTFKGSRGDRARIREEITGDAVCPDPQFAAIIRNLHRRGPLQVEQVNSYLHAADPEGIIEWLTGSVLRTRMERASYSLRLKEIIEMRYKLCDRYLFPMQHLFISAARKS